MPRPIIFGEIEGIEEGYLFNGRKEMMPTSFHRKWTAGIDGNGNEGTSAIVLSGGYEDDFDSGDEIIYTGAGGNSPNNGNQIGDQTWDNPGNAGLLKSMNEGLPVRVIRGSNHISEFSPNTGYKYAGLYSVVDAWEEKGKSGFKICRFRLEYCGPNTIRKSPREIELDYNYREKKRSEGVVIRIIRDSNISHAIKTLYEHKCQVCNLVIKTKSGGYSEGAHIRPLGRPHNGDDNPNNLICLCPNHHVMFDKGTFSILDNLRLIGDVEGSLTIHLKHELNKENLTYHRKIHGYE
jgi:putative restriction endonuclease